MVKKEYTNTGYTVKQIYRAVDTMLADHKADYKLQEDFTDAVLIKCRNGYSWNVLAEIMWDKVDGGHNDLIIECRNDEHDATAVKVQQDDLEKHLRNVDGLFMKYIRMPEPPPPPVVKRNFSKARNMLLAALIVVAALGGIIFYLMEH